MLFVHYCEYRTILLCIKIMYSWRAYSWLSCMHVIEHCICTLDMHYTCWILVDACWRHCACMLDILWMHIMNIHWHRLHPIPTGIFIHIFKWTEGEKILQFCKIMFSGACTQTPWSPRGISHMAPNSLAHPSLNLGWRHWEIVCRNCRKLRVRQVIQVSEHFVNTPSKLASLRIRGDSVLI